MTNVGSPLALPPAWAVNGILVVVMGALLPALLVPIVGHFGHSEILEEAAKALVILVLIRPVNGFKRQLCLGVVLGTLFGISESMLYLGQIVRSGVMEAFWHRLILTVPMHAATTALMVLFGHRWRSGLLAGLAVAVVLHLLFNQQMGA